MSVEDDLEDYARHAVDLENEEKMATDDEARQRTKGQVKAKVKCQTPPNPLKMRSGEEVKGKGSAFSPCRRVRTAHMRIVCLCAFTPSPRASVKPMGLSTRYQYERGREAGGQLPERGF
jgi:hypothetical protein